MTDELLDDPCEGGVIESPLPLWRPSLERIAEAELTKFRGFVSELFPEVDVSTYEALHHWSITATHDFWRCVWDYLMAGNMKATGRITSGTEKEF